ncbi:hypothetical protein EDB84DRAFT_1511390 [Lactarius hengduanensis]|nr:hypothetical protein EDB84DRAFT_1511390 [Lactarius hengduanensis]
MAGPPLNAHLRTQAQTRLQPPRRVQGSPPGTTRTTQLNHQRPVATTPTTPRPKQTNRLPESESRNVQGKVQGPTPSSSTHERHHVVPAKPTPQGDLTEQPTREPLTSEGGLIRLSVLLVFIPLYWIHFVKLDNTLVFIFSFLAIVLLAKLLGFATEELSLRLGQTLAGLLKATLGNAVELIVTIIALVKCELNVVQSSLIGSILSNLLVLGMCFFAGQGFGMSSCSAHVFNVILFITAGVDPRQTPNSRFWSVALFLFLAVLIVNYVQDGKSQGVILICLYVIIGVTFWVYPMSDPEGVLAS